MKINLPNFLTIVRIVLIVPFAVLFFAQGPMTQWFALAIFIAAAATDWFDGYLARRLDQGTPLGRMLDPIADKLLVGAVLLLLVAAGRIANWSLLAALIILLREIAVSGFREHLGPLGVTVPVTRLAKWKTAAQLVALSLLITPIELFHLPGLILLWIAAALTLITGWGYLKATLVALG
jgi:CDP-diacylglycerol--glycerol-3-phosphate 3-phosphatidyltransferase